MNFSLGQQIEEVELELEFRREVFARRIATGRLKKSEAEYRTARLRAVLRTLVWLQNNEASIKQKLRDTV